MPGVMMFLLSDCCQWVFEDISTASKRRSFTLGHLSLPCVASRTRRNTKLAMSNTGHLNEDPSSLTVTGTCEFNATIVPQGFDLSLGS